MKTSSVLFYFSTLAATVSAGSIYCSQQSLNGGRGSIPSHNAAFQLYPQDDQYICDVQLEGCGEMADNPDDFSNEFVNCGGNEGRTKMAAMWITYDGGSKQYTLNVNVQGEGTRSCTSGGVDGCTFE